MTVRRDHYVYIHADAQGSVFYVGMGCGERAWSKDRQAAWLHYVEHHLRGNYSVAIIHERLTEAEALHLEDVTAGTFGSALINVQNQHRPFDYSLWQKHNELAISSRSRALNARNLEQSDPGAAADEYIAALSEAYAADEIDYEPSLYSRIHREISPGDLSSVNRATLCLKRTGCHGKARDIALLHLHRYPLAKNAKQWKVIAKRALAT